jgi:anti-anti-sigma regulatory factor
VWAQRALVRMANDTESAGCGYGLIAPHSQVAKVVRITGLDNRLRVFATIEQALQRLLTPLSASHTPVSVACCA